MSLLKRISIVFTLIAGILLLNIAAVYISYNQIVYAENIDNYVYLGGTPIGINLKCNGVIIERIDSVMTDAGRASLKNYLRPGDNIRAFDGQPIQTVDDIVNYLSSFSGSVATISLCREGTMINVEVCPLKEALTGKFKLGITLKENVMGVGTLTYYLANGRFGCLGHPICDNKGAYIAISGGSVYDCKVLGVIKGEKGYPGELRAVFTSSKLGTIDKNNKFGVYGAFDYTKEGIKIETATRSEVVPGKAYIYTTVSDKPDFYEAEIIKATYQPHIDDKGMVIRITDNRLLNSTGGVVQGMSGSPIIQNEKLVGAVTHVFVNDPTKGYGTYIDWMLEN